MVASTTATPPNSLLLVMDSLGGEIPRSLGRTLVAATESCIAVGCKSVEIPTQNQVSIVSIWVNDRNEPDRVVFGIG